MAFIRAWRCHESLSVYLSDCYLTGSNLTDSNLTDSDLSVSQN
ncbi:hypothetical protein FAP94_14575 [Morganella morganii]|nr:hypothetical protein [Morganella morganii]